MIQDETTGLYMPGQGGNPYSSRIGRTLAAGNDNYTFGGNNPLSAEKIRLNNTGNIDWSKLEGPGPFSGFIGNTAGHATYAVFGDSLTNATDFQLRLGTTAFSAAVVAGGWAALGALGIGGLATAETSYLGAAATTLAYTSLGVSSAQVAFSGGQEGKLNLAFDVGSLGINGLLRGARGLTRGYLLLADIGLNTAQGGRSAYYSQQAFAQGNYVGGILNGAGALLGFASAGVRGIQFDQGYYVRRVAYGGIPLDPDIIRSRPSGVGAFGRGFTTRQFDKFKRGARQLVRRASLPNGELVAHGSRIKGTSHNASDIDIALRVNEETFFGLAEKTLSRARPGTRLRRTMLRRIRQNGQLSSFDLGQEFQILRRELLDIQGL